MSISPPSTWQGSSPGFKILADGQKAVSRTLDMAIQNKNDKEETTAGAFGYEFGAPQKSASDKFRSRFAGDQLIGGINGEFGRITNDPGMVNNQENLKRWAMQWASGPFGLGGPPPPAGMPPEGVA